MKIKIKDTPSVTFLGNNHCTIYTQEGSFLMSYSSVIVFKPIKKGTIQIGKDWKYSPTTGKYRNIFLGEKKPETERKLKEGFYELNKEL